jgi:hypothetical protein
MKVWADAKFLVACVIAGFIAGFCIATSWNARTEKSFWDVASAVGTVAAAVVALGIALWQDHRVARERLERARLNASALTMRVAFARAEVLAATFKLENAARFDCSPDTFEALAIRLGQVKLWDASEIAPLVPLPNECAHNLAAAVDRVAVAISHLTAFGQTSDRMTSEYRKSTAQYIAIVLGEACRMMDAAATEFQKASFAMLLKRPLPEYQGLQNSVEQGGLPQG